jgi:hypothetical protein
MAERLRPLSRYASRLACAAALACLLALALAAAAQADYTHLFEGYVSVPGDSRPQAVDDSGNVYLYSSGLNEVIRIDPDGNPVDFSDLGTNVIDGKGSDNCVTVAASCDQVPTNGLGGSSAAGHPYIQGSTNTQVAIDTSGGPADGYIYVMNTLGKPEPGRVEVFAPSGHFLGELDPTLIGTESCINHAPCEAKGISVDGNGHIYIATKHWSLNHVDQYAPVDGFPGNDIFVGQLRVDNYDAHFGQGIPLGMALEDAVAGSEFTYAVQGNGSHTSPAWRKYSAGEYHHLSGDAIPVDFTPEWGPFGEGKDDGSCVGCRAEIAAIDQRTEHVLLYERSAGELHEYDADNHLVGPVFGGYKIPTYPFYHSYLATAYDPAWSLAIDPSSGPTGGSIYVRGAEANSMAVFGPPVPLPNVTYQAPEDIGHDAATVAGTVQLNGGGAVSECVVEYGFNIAYKHTLPCAPATPYGAETPVSVPLSGLLPGAEYHYRILATNENGTTEGADQSFHTKAVLGVETRPAEAITTHTAKLNGRLDPDAIATTYHFDYGINTLYGHRTPEVSAGNTSGAIDLAPQEIDELQSGRTYHYRLVATNELGTSKGEDATFTVAKAPTIGGAEATEITPTSARLSAQINPGGAATTYHFEYGPTSAYGARIPAGEEPLGTGYEGIAVTQQLSGLQAGLTYHYRVAAENQWGQSFGEDTTFSFNPPSCPNALVRQEGSANELPDCRAYEIVSPGVAGGVQLFAGEGVPDPLKSFHLPYVNEPQNTGYASRPARFSFFGALGSIPGTHAPDSIVDMYVATRSDAGWHTTYPGIPGDQALLVVGPTCSASLDRCFDFHLLDLTKESFSGGLKNDDNGSAVPYLWDVSGKSLGRLPTNAAVVPGADSFSGDWQASADFGHFAFSSNNVAFAPGGLVGAPGSVYDNDVAANTVALASLLPNSEPIPQSGGDAKEFLKVPAVSDDGSHILISAQGATGSVRLYMRVDDAVSYDVSKGHDVQLIGATRDGSKVLFTSNQEVTGDDHDQSRDLFIWSEATDEITRLSQGNGQGDADACSTQWVGQTCDTPVVAPGRSSDDALASGSGGVLFYSPESLDPENPAVPGERNLYLANEGEVHYVATLDAASGIKRVQLSPDGNHAAFLTDSNLTGYDAKGHEEMYSYDAGSGQLKCVSCIPSGDAPANDVFASESGRFMADDGRTFFATSDSLVKRDTNGLRDVYEFVGGRPQLISSGTSSQDSWGGGLLLFPRSTVGLEAVSHDGVDVFFSTFDSLVPQDKNGQFLKFYDARTNGGFHYDAPPLPCTAADECHGAGSQAPGAVEVGSGSSLGAGGNAAPVRKAKKHRQAKAKRHRKGAKAKRGARR